MQPYLETLGIMVIAFAGIFLGWCFSCLRKWYWILGYSIALILACLLVVSRFFYAFNFIKPFDLILAGRLRFVILALAVTIGLTSPLHRLPNRKERLLVCGVMSIVLSWFCILPFLAPALVRGRLEKLEGYVSTEGICFQSTDFTCGPAAAVTALGILGFEADEGQLAILSHTSPVIGTLPQCLADTLNAKYGRNGLECSFRHFGSIEELKQARINLAVVKDSLLSDHCVAVLEVGDDYIILADPARGKEILTYEEFEQVWRFSGISINYNPINTSI